jgi:hypothetical protein
VVNITTKARRYAKQRLIAGEMERKSSALGGIGLENSHSAPLT